MGRSEYGYYAGLGGQGAGLAAFLTTVLGYTLVNKMLSAPWSRPSSSSSRAIRSMDRSSLGLAGPPKSSSSGMAPSSHSLPYQVGLLDLTVPSKHSGNYNNLLLANDICIEKAVQSVSETLYVYLREDPAAVAAVATAAISTDAPSVPVSPTTPELRVYLSELYGQLWDVCNLHRNLPLDVRVLYNTTEPALPVASALPVDKTLATPGLQETSASLHTASVPSPVPTPPSSAQKAHRPGGNPTSWEEVLLKPELQVVFTRHSSSGSDELTCAKRAALGLPPVNVEWLDEATHVALSTPFYYLEDEKTCIPHFPRVALGGTFDRLHNGHKKLLSLAACICQSRLTIGITSTEMLAKKKNAGQIEPLEERIDAVQSFLLSVFPNLAVDVVVLKDPFGPPVHDPNFDAIVVSSETIAGAAKINEIRAEKDMAPLVIVVTRRTVSSLLSSTFIRNNLPARRRFPR